MSHRTAALAAALVLVTGLAGCPPPLTYVALDRVDVVPADVPLPAQRERIHAWRFGLFVRGPADVVGMLEELAETQPHVARRPEGAPRILRDADVWLRSPGCPFGICLSRDSAHLEGPEPPDPDEACEEEPEEVGATGRDDETLGDNRAHVDETAGVESSPGRPAVDLNGIAPRSSEADLEGGP